MQTLFRGNGNEIWRPIIQPKMSAEASQMVTSLDLGVGYPYSNIPIARLGAEKEASEVPDR